MKHYLGASHFLLCFLLLQFFITGNAFSESTVISSNSKDGYELLLAGGAYSGSGGNSLGVGISLGLAYDRDDTRYTLKANRFVDTWSNHRCPDINIGMNCEGAYEVALLYGKKWNPFWITSIGLGYLNGKDYREELPVDRKDFSTFGLAYSVLWDTHMEHYVFELSGNVNSVGNYLFFSIGNSFK
jgi:hypothetical protein